MTDNLGPMPAPPPPAAEPLSNTARIERSLLILGGVFMVVNLIAMALVRGFRMGDWVMLAVWVVCAAGGVWVLENQLSARDPLLFPVTMILTGWGLVIIDRLSDGFIYNFADRQTIWLVFGVIAMMIVAVRPEPLHILREYRYLLLAGGLVLLVSTIVLGTNPSGMPLEPRLWLGFGPLFIQPSEPLKIMLVSFLASYLAEEYPTLRAEHLDTTDKGALTLFGFSPRTYGPILLMWSLCVVLLVWQRDLGTAVVYFGVFLVLLYVASSNLLVIVGGSVLTLMAGVAGYLMSARVRLRVDIWLNPWPEANENAYQVVQSLMAFGAGGVFGQGIGQGEPGFIPVVHSDFVFAALAEEWGLLGVVTVLGCFAVLIARGMRAAVRQQDRPFYALMAVGLSALLGVQMLLITGGVLKVLPLTGVTLPFISYGGSSLLTSFVAIGFLLRISARQGAL